MHALFVASALWALQPADTAEAFQKKVKQAADKACKAAVFVGGGSGFIISPDGYMMTNFHVSSTESKETTVQLMDGRRLKATKVAADRFGDVSLMKIDSADPLPYVEFGDSDALEPGTYVLAIGNPFRAGDAATGEKRYSTVTLGVVSAIHRCQNNYRDAIQTDAAVNPGNSGGMLVTLDAKVVGMNGQIATRHMNRVNSGVGFAIPSVQLQRFLPALKADSDGRVSRGTIKGLAFEAWKPAEMPWGVPKIATVDPGSPAETAGFQPGDLVTGIEGYDVPSYRRFQGVLCTYPEGTDVKVRVKRGAETVELKLALDPDSSGRVKPTDGPPADSGWAGFTAEDGDNGVRIVEVEPNSPAADAGLQPDDIVTRYGDRQVKTLKGTRNGLYNAMGRHKPGDTVALHVKRGDDEFDVELRLSEAPPED